MLRRSLLMTVALLTAVVLTGCDTVTDLSEVTMEGRWDSVGALRAQMDQVTLMINPQSADGSFDGTWRVGNVVNAVTNGSKQGESVQFTLQGFFGQSVTFTGRLTDRFRMEGNLDGVPLDGPAVFRLSSL
jgi:hypothetical protein